MRWGSILVGAMGLAVLEAVVSSKQATGNVGAALTGVGSLVRKFISPQVAAFSSASSSSSGAQTTSMQTAAAAPSPSTTPLYPGAAGSGGTVLV